MDELIKKVRALRDSGHQGWDQEALWLIVKHFYGNTNDFINAHLGFRDEMRWKSGPTSAARVKEPIKS